VITDGRRAVGWGVLVAGLGALAIAPILVLRPAYEPEDAGTLPAAALPSATATPSPSASASAGSRPEVPQRWTPARVVIPGLKVEAPVQAVGVAPDGELDIPEDPQRLGWWLGSALPGDRRGTVLVAGHVDTARDGRGALFGLERLDVGARIDVAAGDRTLGYRVAARRTYLKSRLPADLFERDTAPRLVLVTCGGAFRNGTYDRNVVVYATPIRAGTPSARSRPASP
jgi:hypothetical protein